MYWATFAPEYREEDKEEVEEQRYKELGIVTISTGGQLEAGRISDDALKKYYIRERGKSHLSNRCLGQDIGVSVALLTNQSRF